MPAGGSVSGSRSTSKTTSKVNEPNYRVRIPDIEAARRLMLGSILNQFGDSPYGAADLSFGAQPMAAPMTDQTYRPELVGPPPMQPIKPPAEPRGFAARAAAAVGRQRGRQMTLREALQ